MKNELFNYRFLLRSIGIIIFIILLYNIDFHLFKDILNNIDVKLLGLSIIMLFPLVGIKTLRWKYILKKYHIDYNYKDAYLAFFSSIYIGVLTPGRLGEFIRSFYVSNDCKLDKLKSISSVLIDRLFDFYILLIIGIFSIYSLSSIYFSYFIQILIIILFISFGIVIIRNKKSFNYLTIKLFKKYSIINDVFNYKNWFNTLHAGLNIIDLNTLLKLSLLTIVSYTVFFYQSYILSISIGMATHPINIIYSVTLGSLITLIPISISGIGTRELIITSFLSTKNIDTDISFAFSILIFLNFYIITALIGFLSWLIKPIPIKNNN